MKTCKSCHQKIPNSVSYCSYCGSSQKPPFAGIAFFVIVLSIIGIVSLSSFFSTSKAVIDQNPISSLISTETVTPTKTNEAASQPKPSSPFTPTATPTATYKHANIPSITSTSVSSCPGAPPQRLEVDEDAKVCTKKDSLILRSGPSKSSDEITRLKPGTVVWVVDGPMCANNWSYWKVRFNDGRTGWLSEGGDNSDPYFLCPN